MAQIKAASINRIGLHTTGLGSLIRLHIIAFQYHKKRAYVVIYVSCAFVSVAFVLVILGKGNK